MGTQTYVRLRTDDERISEHPQNPNQGDVDSIRESMDRNGWFGAIVYQKSTGYILVGNHRWRTARERGESEIDAFERDCDDYEALDILMSDNLTAKLGTIEEQQAAEIVGTLANVGRELTGTPYDLTFLEQHHDSDGEGGGADVPEWEDWESQYGVIVVCEDEAHQERIFAQLSEQGLTCRVVVA